ncbi:MULTISPECIES: hypothetical protein [unclassified Marinobacterium]|nr:MULTISPECIES: hypothetical protein [unclassified Marinobacterium]NRP53832.1 hypothetical protein [Marinobacterium sp. xm-v-242]NRP58423.1 hypothetical protein [Marinobacterium sp. xm-d-510]NRP60642.1 hypothetical protein [Marinobacterium sp. xm-d-564]
MLDHLEDILTIEHEDLSAEDLECCNRCGDMVEETSFAGFCDHCHDDTYA